MNNNSLNTTDANHLTLKCKQLAFEILGGINPQNYQSLWVMLVTTHNRVKHRDNVDLFNQEQLQAYKRKVAEVTGIHRDSIALDFEKLITELEEYKMDLQKNPNKPISKTFQLSDEQRAEAIELLKKPKLLATINEMMGKSGIIGNDTNRLILFLTYLTRKTKTGLHAVIQSKYNYLQSKLRDLIPDEEKYILSYLSDNALFYFTEEELQNKVVLVEDTGNNRKILLPLIGFQHSNVITKTTVKKNEYAELVTVQKHVKGNVSLSISTKEENYFAKYGLLSFVLNEDFGSEQDKRVLLYQRQQSAGLVNEFVEKKIVEQIQNIQRVLEPVAVINPFAMDLELPEQIRNKQVTNLHYLRFIEIITFLKQYQRTKKVNEATGEIFIETTIEDIKEANELLSEILLNRSDKINNASRIHLEQLKNALAADKLKSEAFTLLEASIALQVPKSTLKRYVKIWVDAGLVLSSDDKGQAHTFQLANTNEYKDLQASINKSLDANIISMESKLSGTKRKTKANQNKNGSVKVLNSNVPVAVNHVKVEVA